MQQIHVPVLIVGAGGSGLAMSLFLADLGVESLLVERHATTSSLPKAHYINQRTMEILRQQGAADAVYAKAAPRANHAKVYWQTSLGGDGPFDRIVFHEQPIMGAGALADRYDALGTTHATNIPQIRFEPVLLAEIGARPRSQTRFRHELMSFAQDDDGVTAVVRDLDGGDDLPVRCRYLIGADAGRTVGPSLGITKTGDQHPMHMMTVWVRADFSSYITADDCVIRFIFHPSYPTRMGGLLTFGPTHWDGHSEEWGVSYTVPGERLSDEEYFAGARDYLNVDVPMEMLKVQHWNLQIEIADRFSEGRVILIGDAAHAHPPGAGLGLNSGIQDAHNLAWKLAAVLHGTASPALLETYEAERRPVIERNADWGMLTMRNYAVLINALGVSPMAPREQNEAAFAGLLADTPLGATRRAMLDEVFGVQRMEYAAHDMEMGFQYTQGALVDDGSAPPVRDPMGSVYTPSTRPGCRLPHAWLRCDGERRSTHDLIPLGGFAVLTGLAGGAWVNAAVRVAADTGVTIRGVRIGPGADATDPSGQWTAVRGIADDGVVLVRPDTHVAFRAAGMTADPEVALRDALERILGRAAG